MYTLGELAEKLNLAFSGDGELSLVGLAPLEGAGPQDLTFIADKKYLPQLSSVRAAAVILHPDLADQCPVSCLLSEAPYVTYAQASQLFDNAPVAPVGVHSRAVVSPDAQLDPSARVAANAVVEAGAVLGAGVIVGANAYVGHGSKLGAGTRLHPNVTVYHDVWLGEHCVVHSQAVLGADGFGFAPSKQGWEKICQLGGIRIGDRVEIGAGTTIDRGALDHTVIEDGVILDNQVHIAHNVSIGKNTAIAGCTGVAGSTKIGANCTIAGMVGVVGQAFICDNVHISAMAMVTKSITEPGSYSSGVPVSSTREWRRNAVRFTQLDAMHRRLVRLEGKKKT